MKKCIIVLLAVVVLFSSVVPKQTACADGLTLAAIASGAYAIASASGMDFAFTGYDGLGVSQWMQNRINSWLAGRTVAEAFGSEVIRLTAGKLVIPSAAVAGIVSFLSDVKTKNNISENGTVPTQLTLKTVNGFQIYEATGGTYKNQPLYSFGAGSPGCEVSKFMDAEEKFRMQAYGWNGEALSSVVGPPTRHNHELGWFIGKISSYYSIFAVFVTDDGTYYSQRDAGGIGLPSGATESGPVTAIIPGLYNPPEGLNDLQSWEGTVANAPDTNIDDLLDDIFDQSAAGTLDVTGEVVDTPAEPQVSPVPTTAPGDVIGLDTISGQLESIDNTMTGVQEGVGEAVGQLEGINEGVGSISEALEVPTASEAPAFKFDLTTLFPFCIPFDIYRFVTMFSASPVAPHVQIPFNIPAVGLQYTFDLDFSSFDGVASVLRSVELIAFCVGLAILTSKVIRW